MSIESEPYGTDPHIEALLGKRLKEYRLDRNITQADLAEKAGVSRRTVTSIEKGEGSTLSTLIRLLRALGKLSLLNPLLEELPVSPNRMLEMEESFRKQKRKYASRPRKKTVEDGAKPWVWGDEKS